MKEFKKNWLIVMCICLVAFCGLMMSGNSSTAVKAEDTDIEIAREIKTENNEDELSPMASTNVTSTAGRITWRYIDSNDVKPLRTVKVEICKKSGSSYTVLGTVYTNTNGYYSLSSHQSVSSDNIVLRIYPESVFCKVYSYAGSSPTAYVREVSAGTVSGNKKTINYSAVICRSDTSGNDTESIKKMECTVNVDKDKVYFDNALMVLQLVNFSGRYVKEIHGQNLAKITVYFHHGQKIGNVGCFYRRSNGTRAIYLQFNDCSWFYSGSDTVMHEYGHYISDLLNLTSLPGGDHSGNCYDHNINENTPITKSHALQLAFSEGVATYFAKAAQYYFKEEAVDWGEKFAYYNADMTEGDVGYGEMGESTTTCVLSALCGFKQDYVSLGLGDKKTLALLKEFTSSSYGNSSTLMTLPQFIKLMYSKEYINKEALGFILTECEAAPLIKSVSKAGNTFNITFVANGGSSLIKNNVFDFVLYNGEGDEIYRKNSINTTPVSEFNDGVNNIYETREATVTVGNVNFSGRTYSVSLVGHQTELNVISGGYYSRLYTVENNPIGNDIIISDDVGDEKYCEFTDILSSNESKEYYLYFPSSGKYVIQTLGLTTTSLTFYNNVSGELIATASKNGYLTNSLVVVDVYSSCDYKLIVQNKYYNRCETGNAINNQKRNIKIVITPSEIVGNNQSASGIYSYHYPDVETILSVAQYQKTNMCTLSVENGGMTKIKTNTYGDHYDTCLYLANVYSMFDATIADSLDSNYSAEINQVLFTGQKYLLVNSLYNINLLNYSFAIDISQ